MNHVPRYTEVYERTNGDRSYLTERQIVTNKASMNSYLAVLQYKVNSAHNRICTTNSLTQLAPYLAS